VVISVPDLPVKIVVDSTANIPADLLSENDISVVPVCIQIGDQTYDEDVNITREQFYQALLDGKQPMTSQPSPGAFYRVYQTLVDQARSIVSIHVTGRHSGTVQSASLAAQMFPRADITVVDSELVSGAMGLLALVAAKAAKLGSSKEEILRAIEEAKHRISVFVCVPTLAYLRRSGRVSFTTAAVADVLSIKPILTIRSGLLQVAARVRSFRNALDRAISMAEEQVGRAKVQIAIIHANVPEAAEDFRRAVEQRLNVASLFVADMGSALAAHGGPGMIGLACLKV
jgi:DegV family protein with EDD domain